MACGRFGINKSHSEHWCTKCVHGFNATDNECVYVNECFHTSSSIKPKCKWKKRKVVVKGGETI